MGSRSAALVAVLLASSASAESTPACRREADGRVSCDAEGFGLLTRSALEARGRAEECSAQLGAARETVAARERELAACEAEPEPTPEPTPPERGASRIQLVGFAVGLLGAAIVGAAASSVAHDGITSTTPVLVSVVGAAGIVTGAVLLSW